MLACPKLSSFLQLLTFLDPMQLIDELFMVYMMCTVFYAVFSHQLSKRGTSILMLFTISLAAFITGYYHHIKKPEFHQGMFNLITFTTIGRSIYLMEAKLRPMLLDSDTKSQGSSKQGASAKSTDQIMKTMWRLVSCGLICMFVGMAIWTSDTKFCSVLVQWRRQIGLPWGIFLEGHGWW